LSVFFLWLIVFFYNIKKNDSLFGSFAISIAGIIAPNKFPK
jgi:hypothetical protein